MRVVKCPRCGDTQEIQGRVAICDKCKVFMTRQPLVDQNAFEQIDPETMIQEAKNG